MDVRTEEEMEVSMLSGAQSRREKPVATDDGLDIIRNDRSGPG